MRQLLAAVVAGLVVAGAGAQPDAPAKSIDGTYKVLAATFGGKAKEDIEKVELVFAKGTIVVRENGQVKDDDAKYTLDPSKTPGHIDIMGKGDKLMLGIYQTKATKAGLELTLAFTKDGDRPTEFKADDARTVVMTLQRQGEK